MQVTMNYKQIIPAVLLVIWSVTTQAFELQPVKVADNIWALVGEIGPRTADNHALNNTLGFVITDAGVVLIGSGATPAGAQLIEQSVARITGQPIRWVINIGAQDHHWMGNSYFSDKGVEIIALARTVTAQKQHVEDHMRRLQTLNSDEAATVRPTYAMRTIEADQADLNLGGEKFQLKWPGNGHFPGDTIVWIPQQKIAFVGDFVFNDRMLGIHTFTPVMEWKRSFEEIASLDPVSTIPGHGFPDTFAKAQRDTGDYLTFLVEGVSKALEDWKDLSETTDILGEAPQFRHLKFYEGWHRRNINRTYLQLESAQ